MEEKIEKLQELVRALEAEIKEYPYSSKSDVGDAMQLVQQIIGFIKAL